MRPGPRARALFLTLGLLSCGKPAPTTCPLDALDRVPDGGSSDGGLDGGLNKGNGGPDLCAACGTGPEELGARGSCGRVRRVEVTQASGIAAGARHPEAFYAVRNTFGEPPRFFAFDPSGADLGASRLDGATIVDVEDIAVGPCPGGDSCVYIADIGDNDLSRTEYVIYRVLEPFSLSAGERAVAGFDTLRFRYPDGSHDAEALLVDPATGLLTVVTRDRSGSGTALVYEFPASQPSTASPSTLLARGPLSAPPGADRFTVTDGDVHPEGQSVLLRTSLGLFFYPMQPERSVADALGGTPCLIPLPVEEQDEAIGWLRSGSGYVTVGKRQSTDVTVVVCGATEPRDGGP